MVLAMVITIVVVRRAPYVQLLAIAVPNFRHVQQKQIDRVQVANRDNIKILLHTQVFPVNHVLVHVASVLNIYAHPQKQIIHVQYVK